MHGADGVEILFDDRFDRAPTFLNVALEPADETQVVSRIHEDFDVHQLPQRGVGEDQNAFEDQYRLRLDMDRLVPARMRGKVVNRRLDRLACAQRLHVINEQIVVQRVWMVEVYPVPQLDRHVSEVAIVTVLLQKDHTLVADVLQNAPRDGRLARSCAPTYSDYHLILGMGVGSRE